MKSRLAIAGALLLLASAQSAHAETVYERLLQFSQDEYALEKSELIVEKFVKKIYPKKYLPDFQDSDVDLALQEQSAEICRPSDPENNPMDQDECAKYRELVVTLVDKNSQFRQVARDLQLAATTYEMSIDNYPGGVTSILSKLPSIIKIWQGDTDLVQSPIAEIKVRGQAYDTNMDPLFNAVESELNGLIESANGKKDRERFIAAVWRYRHGYRQVRNLEGGCTNDKLGDGTELQFLRARFCAVEQKLEAIWNQVQGIPMDPPLKPNEIVLFPIKIFEDIQVYVWVRLDDVGLMWTVQLEPVIPSLDCSGARSFAQPNPPCRDEAILGGTYPAPIPDPPEGTGLCSHPFAKRGYLCRPRDTIECMVEPGSAATGEDIHLIGCKAPNMEAPYRWTEAGPNICNEGGWRVKTQGLKQGTDTPAIDTDLAPDWCSNCYVDTLCGSCGGSQEGQTKPKEADGRIQICLNPTEPAMSTYLYIHELVHAAQNCDSPSIDLRGSTNLFIDIYLQPEGCCATEYQAYLAQCDAMGEDGVLEGVGIDIQTCAAAMTNFSCGGGSSCVQLPPGTSSNQILQDIVDYVGAHAAELGVATSCAQAVNSPDARVLKAKSSLPQVCTPKCETKYASTIGNNACMVGQCVEESFERHRLIPGRMPLVTQDEAFPWDSDSDEDPNFGEFLLMPPALSMPLPPYRPALLARQMDNFLCQLNGLPTKVPPILCSFDPRRRLRLPTKGFLELFESLINQPSEQESLRHMGERVASAVGSRVGTQVYTEYLSSALHAFEELIQAASDLLTNLESTEFPEEMCRRNADNP